MIDINFQRWQSKHELRMGTQELIAIADHGYYKSEKILACQ